MAVDEEKDTKAPQAAAAPSGQSGGEVDISDVQSQYWRAHDKDFEVVQNKQYTKSGRIEITPEFGLYQRGGFQDTQTVGLAAAYHFSDIWGIELSGYKMFTSDSYTLTQFKQQTGATIDFNPEHYYMGGELLFAPDLRQVLAPRKERSAATPSSISPPAMGVQSRPNALRPAPEHRRG